MYIIHNVTHINECKYQYMYMCIEQASLSTAAPVFRIFGVFCVACVFRRHVGFQGRCSCKLVGVLYDMIVQEFYMELCSLFKM